MERDQKRDNSDREKPPLARLAKEAEKNAKDKPLKTFRYEADLSTSVYPLRSTIQFGKYKLADVGQRALVSLLIQINRTDMNIASSMVS